MLIMLEKVLFLYALKKEFKQVQSSLNPKK